MILIYLQYVYMYVRYFKIFRNIKIAIVTIKIIYSYYVILNV